MVRSSQIFIYNHLEVLKGLVTKSGIVRSLKQFYYNNESASKIKDILITRIGQSGYSIFDSTPTTFLLASGVEDAEHIEMVQRYKDF